MSFFVGDQQLDVLNVTGSYNAGTRTLSSVRIQNNSDITLNVEGLKVNPNNPQLSNPDQVTTLKIVIDWGDGNTESIAPFFIVKNSSINVKHDPWYVVSHTYSLYTQQTNLNITIYVYNSLNDCLIITIPVVMQFQSLLESGAKLNLVSANITNDNRVSYVINNSTEDSNFVVASIS